jgi:NAD(P)-dependent dehydrogenase (short-subunit alcohol dehydrogenase family)
MSAEVAAQPVSLITGASSGFGLLIAVELARRGQRVFASMRDLRKADRLKAAAAAAGVSVELVTLDVTQQASIDAAVAEIEAKAGRIDILVNNAGFGLAGFAEDLTLDELRDQFETNFFGAVAVTKAVLPGMRVRRRGQIIMISSINGLLAVPCLSAYCASKFALEGFSESLRHELRPHNVYVVLVEPGTFKTEIFEQNRRVAKAAESESSPHYARARKIEAYVNNLVATITNDPREVALLVGKITATKQPRLRYLVGNDAQKEAFARRYLPFSLIESEMARLFGDPAGGQAPGSQDGENKGESGRSAKDA